MSCLKFPNLSGIVNCVDMSLKHWNAPYVFVFVTLWLNHWLGHNIDIELPWTTKKEGGDDDAGKVMVMVTLVKWWWWWSGSDGDDDVGEVMWKMQLCHTSPNCYLLLLDQGPLQLIEKVHLVQQANITTSNTKQQQIQNNSHNQNHISTLVNL